MNKTNYFSLFAPLNSILSCSILSVFLVAFLLFFSPFLITSTQASDAFQEFESWVRDYLQTPEEVRDRLIDEGVELAKQRKGIMTNLMLNNPDKAFKKTIPSYVRQNLPVKVQDHIETHFDLKGDITVTVVNGEKPTLDGDPRENEEGLEKIYGIDINGGYRIKRRKGIDDGVKNDVRLVGIRLDHTAALSKVGNSSNGKGSFLNADNEFKAWLSDYIKTPIEIRHRIERDGIELARQRKNLIKTEMLKNPHLALERAVPDYVYGMLPLEIKRYVEKEFDQIGHYSVDIPEIPKRKRSKLNKKYLIELFDGERFRGYSIAKQKNHPTVPFRNIQMRGIKLGYTAALSYIENPNSSALSPSENWTKGGKDVLVMRMLFADESIEFDTPHSVHENGAGDETFPVTKQWVLDDMDTVNVGIREFSYDLASIDRPEDEGDIPNVLTYDDNYTDFFINDSPRTNKLYEDALDKVEDEGWDPDDFQFHAVVTSAYCIENPTALGRIGRPPSWYIGRFRPSTITHELGHNFGVWHSNFWFPDQGDPNHQGDPDDFHEEYWDFWDRMGGGGFGDEDWDRYHFNDWFKKYLHWLSEATSPTGDGWYKVTESDTYRLTRHDDRDAGGIRSLNIHTQDKEDRNFWIGHRKNFPQDYPRVDNGITVRWNMLENEVMMDSGARLLHGNPGEVPDDPGDFEPEDTLGHPVEVGDTFAKPGSFIIEPVETGGDSPNFWIDVVVSFDTHMVSNIRHEETSNVLWQSFWELKLENEESFFDSGRGNNLGFLPFELDIYDVTVDQIEREEREDACPDRWKGLYSSLDLKDVSLTSFTDTPGLKIERDFEVYRQCRISAEVTENGDTSISGAEAKLFDDQDNLRQETETNRFGNFHFCGVNATNLPDTVPESPNHYRITIDHPDFKEKTIDNIDLSPGELKDLGTLELEPENNSSNSRFPSQNDSSVRMGYSPPEGTYPIRLSTN